MLDCSKSWISDDHYSGRVGNNGLPFGIGIIQTALGEDLLITYGSAIEGLTGLRPKPKFLNLGANNYLYVGNPPAR